MLLLEGKLKSIFDYCWSRLAREPQQLSEPLILKGEACSLQIKDTDMVDTFSLFSGDEKVKLRPYLRAYVNGKMNPELEQRIWMNPPISGEGFRSWFQRIFQRNRCGIILNRAERWATVATNNIAYAIHPLISKEEPLAFELEIIIFAGDYGFTPFGIHQDEPCSSVFHFNIGPSPKSIIVFKPEDIETFSKSELRRGGIGKLLAKGKQYRINPGDAFLLPANYYHIGESNEFTIDISCKLTFKDPLAIAQKALLNLNDNIKLSKDSANTPINYMFTLLRVQNHTSSAENVVKNIFKSASNSWLSNSGFLESPIEVCPIWNPESLFKASPYFPIIWEIWGNEVVVHSRGKELHIANERQILLFLECITNDKCSIANVVKNILPESSLIHLINWLLSTGGIKKI